LEKNHSYPKEILPKEDIFDRWLEHQISSRQTVINHLLRSHFIITILTFFVILLQGFRFMGFALDPEFFYHWVGPAFFGEVAILILIVILDIFFLRKVT